MFTTFSNSYNNPCVGRPQSTPRAAVAGLEEAMSDVLKHLLALGLTQYEGQAYEALLHQSPLNASEISKMTGIPPGKVYSVLENLVREGFCLMIPGKRKRFSAVCPKAAVGGLVESRRRTELEWEQRVTTAAEELDRQYEARLENDSTADYVSVYTTPESMKTKFWELCLGCASLIRAFSRPPYLLATFSATAERDKRNSAILAQKGIELRTVCEADHINPQEFEAFAGACVRSGQSVRVAERLPLKIHIFDQDAVLLTLTDHPFCRRMCYSLLIRHAAHAAAMIELFELHWARALPLEEHIAAGRAFREERRTA
jgi:DNA-binding transcriptional regulator GbsR (MarR family)